MHTYKITLKSDTGRHTIKTIASDIYTAEERVLRYEGAPRIAIVKSKVVMPDIKTIDIAIKRDPQTLDEVLMKATICLNKDTVAIRYFDIPWEHVENNHTIERVEQELKSIGILPRNEKDPLDIWCEKNNIGFSLKFYR